MPRFITLPSLTDITDATKRAVFDLSGLTTATTRTITVPDGDSTLINGLTQSFQGSKTWLGQQNFNAAVRYTPVPYTATGSTVTLASLATFDATSGTQTQTLTTSTNAGLTIDLVKIDSTSNTITFGGTFNGMTGLTLAFPGQVVRIQATSTAGSWRVIYNSQAGVLYALTGPGTVTNTAAETTIYNGATGWGTRSIGNGGLIKGAVYEGVGEGSYQTGTLADQVNVRAKLGSVNIAAINVAASVLATSSLTNPLQGRVRFTVVDVASNVARISATVYMKFGIAANATTELLTNTADGVRAGLLTGSTGFTAALATVDVPSNAAQLFDITETWASARVGQGTTMTDGYLRRIA